MHKFSSYFSGALLAGLFAAQAIGEQPTVQGTVAWRFEVLANYISHRADVARDGTVYFNDSSGFLYALTPEGALRWVYDGQSVGSAGPTVVGRDGTIYFGLSVRTPRSMRSIPMAPENGSSLRRTPKGSSVDQVLALTATSTPFSISEATSALSH